MTDRSPVITLPREDIDLLARCCLSPCDYYSEEGRLRGGVAAAVRRALKALHYQIPDVPDLALCPLCYECMGQETGAEHTACAAVSEDLRPLLKPSKARSAAALRRLKRRAA